MLNSFKIISPSVFILALGLVTCSQTASKTAPETKTPVKVSTGSVQTHTGVVPASGSTKSTRQVKTGSTAVTSVTKSSNAKNAGTGTKTKVSTTRTVVKSQSQNSNTFIPSTSTVKVALPGVSGPTGISNTGQQNTSTGKISTGSDATPPQNSKSSRTGVGAATASTGPTASSGKTGTQTSGGVLNNILGTGSGNITELDASSAIREALMKGVTKAVSQVSVTDGYFKNNLIKIPFPQDAKVIESTMRTMGMGSTIDNLVVSLNRAAESAANQAGPIFINGIKQMTISDALNIVGNQQPDAATKFLQRTTTESLVTAFKPPIKTALDKTLATKYWNDLVSNYNRIPFVQKINPDLNDFVTRKAISGLFYVVGQEEAKIRKDPVGQGSKIIETVFGSVLKR